MVKFITEETQHTNSLELLRVFFYFVAEMFEFTGFFIDKILILDKVKNEKGELPCKSNSPLRYLILANQIAASIRPLRFGL